MFFVSIALFLVFLTLTTVNASGEEDWEWSAALCVEGSAATYNWNFAKVDDTYAALTMKMVILSTTEEGKAGVTAKESAAEDIFDGTTGSTVVATANDTLVAGNYLYVLTMENGNWMTVFNMDLPVGEYAIFLEHDPDEFHFEDMDSYFTNSDGDEATFDWTSSDSTSDSDNARWDLAYGASTLVWVVCFSMICLFYVLKLTSKVNSFTLELVYLQMFAAGTLLAAALSLVVFESARSLPDETGVASLWGTCAILGFVCSSVLDMTITPLIASQESAELAEPDSVAVEMTASKGDYEVGKTEAVEGEVSKDIDENDTLKTVGLLSIREMLAVESSRKTFLAIMIGDFIHNYCDGIVIGSAFSQCTTKLGWSIAIVTILHELPQELSDASILVDQIHLGHVWAALSNLICGAGVLLGCATVNAIDVNEETKAYFLAFGAGNFLYLATVEFFGTVIKSKKANDVPMITRCVRLAFFAVGALIILLIAMDHAHCESESDDESSSDAHADH